MEEEKEEEKEEATPTYDQLLCGMYYDDNLCACNNMINYAHEIYINFIIKWEINHTVIKRGNILAPLHGIAKGHHIYYASKMLNNNGESCTVSLV